MPTFTPPSVTSPLRDVRVTARVGRVLGIAVAICFVTGLLSHVQQHPSGWLTLPPVPQWGYRLTQGLHVATGTAAIPLVLVKLFSVYPLLFRWPPVRSVVHALERVSIAVLVASVLFELATGVMNTVHWYAWPFFFTSTHYALAWVVVGALLVHLAVKAPVIAGALAERLDDEAGRGLTRRGLLLSTAAAAGTITLVTVGQTVPGLSRLTLLAPRRPDIGPQSFPVNGTAVGAKVKARATSADWRLTVAGPTMLSLSLAELTAMPQQEVELSIACVDGWSAAAPWGGIRLADLLDRAAIPAGSHIRVTSLQKAGLYRSSLLTPAVARHSDTLLALRLRGEPLALDHGYPLRLIAPNRPGVLQTKWLDRIEVV